VESFVASAKLNRHYGRELSYVLPRQHVSSFPPLFSKLESLVNGGEASVMGFNSYGVSMTTLEEVYIANYKLWRLFHLMGNMYIFIILGVLETWRGGRVGRTGRRISDKNSG
jgi:hypothetical protein